MFCITTVGSNRPYVEVKSNCEQSSTFRPHGVSILAKHHLSFRRLFSGMLWYKNHQNDNFFMLI